MEVVVLDTFEDVSLERAVLEGPFRVRQLDPALSDAEIAAAAPDAEALLLGLRRVGDELLGALPRLRHIARYGIGVDNVDLAAAARRGITVTNVPDFCIEEVSVHALTMALALVRRLPAAQHAVAAGRWGFASAGPVRRISALRFGVVGTGPIGRATAALAAGVGFECVSWSRRGTIPGVPALELDELLATSDVVSLHLPSSPETRGLLDAERLATMRDGAILVNTARGDLVELEALLDEVDRGRLAAALDVLPHEPPPKAPPSSTELIVTPHMAFYSTGALEQMRRSAAEEVHRVLNGTPPRHPVPARSGAE